MNLFVSKLNPATTDKDLQKHFSNYGGVTATNGTIDNGSIQFETEYQFPADQDQSPGNDLEKSNKYNSVWTIKPRWDNSNRRNYGYRGSGFPYFK